MGKRRNLTIFSAQRLQKRKNSPQNGSFGCFSQYFIPKPQKTPFMPNSFLLKTTPISPDFPTFPAKAQKSHRNFSFSPHKISYQLISPRKTHQNRSFLITSFLLCVSQRYFASLTLLSHISNRIWLYDGHVPFDQTSQHHCLGLSTLYTAFAGRG